MRADESRQKKEKKYDGARKPFYGGKNPRGALEVVEQSLRMWRWMRNTRSRSKESYFEYHDYSPVVSSCHCCQFNCDQWWRSGFESRLEDCAECPVRNGWSSADKVEAPCLDIDSPFYNWDNISTQEVFPGSEDNIYNYANDIVNILEEGKRQLKKRIRRETRSKIK